MTISEYRKLQKLEEERNKLLPMQKISNNFLDNTIFKNNTGALKTIFYLSTILKDMDLKDKDDESLIDLEIDLKEFISYSMLDERIVKRSVKAMQETSISFITTEELNGKKKIKEELHISLLPMYKIIYGKSKIHLKLFVKIAKLFIDVESNWTYLNTKQFMKLDSKHSIRMLGLLNKIDDYDCKIKKENIEAQIQKNLDPIQSGLIKDEKQKQAIYKKNRELKTKDIAKVKEMDLDDLNEFFGTSYTKWAELERKILKPAQEELESKSPLYFWYDVNYESVGVGRPKFSSVRIYPKLQSGIQTRLASFI